MAAFARELSAAVTQVDGSKWISIRKCLSTPSLSRAVGVAVAVPSMANNAQRLRSVKKLGFTAEASRRFRAERSGSPAPGRAGWRVWTLSARGQGQSRTTADRC